MVANLPYSTERADQAFFEFLAPYSELPNNGIDIFGVFIFYFKISRNQEKPPINLGKIFIQKVY
jgi:hypothetical protein